MRYVALLGLGLVAIALPPAAPGLARSTAEAPASSGIEKADFFKAGDAPVRQGQAEDITVIYFFDYQCPTCRKYHADVSKALDEDRKVRVIYRDTPMLGDKSDAAAYAAIAAKYQGRHAAMHEALMSTKVALDEAGIRAAAQKARVDWDRLQRDMKRHKAEMDDLIRWNFELATEAGVYGTPAFIVGDSLSNGALDYAGLKGEIADARKALKPADAAAPTGPAAETGSLAADEKEVAVEPASAPIFKPSPAAEEPSGNTAGAGQERATFPLAWLAIASGLAAAAAAALVFRRRRSA